ncbi:hypothetical protein CXF78_00120 [Shewanella sp. 11B5]|nr:hypothetical protein CXF78_00120 [Shewanella sp. 11B5]
MTILFMRILGGHLATKLTQNLDENRAVSLNTTRCVNVVTVLCGCLLGDSINSRSNGSLKFINPLILLSSLYHSNQVPLLTRVSVALSTSFIIAHLVIGVVKFHLNLA